ncbi:GMC oxidoreductase [Pseudonocardia alaniniphila]|uniref:GMC oxidoreductase n=1 Tax=Pseudonocardia alaniniphila TaxID=75291 RepID=A0ABS9THB7_9PSEU|nr:GMC oxidoreductase [Pseudonocardia alaniniphila]MCH6167676.1 GMC oxidoreductase [Pseudonocardia alaniniphila]
MRFPFARLPVDAPFTVGGCSAINAMVYLCGHRDDYDTWARQGTSGWAFHDVLPYFRRMESVPHGDPRFRGTTGPMRPSPAHDPNPLSAVFLAAAAAVGHPITPDFIQGVEMARAVVADGAFDGWRGAELHPGGETTGADDLEQFVRRATGTYCHPVGTCAMGSGDDAVVTPDLRVRGVENLRVIDASVMPRIVSVNTNVPTIMIAEQGAELIRGRTSSTSHEFAKDRQGRSLVDYFVALASRHRSCA